MGEPYPKDVGLEDAVVFLDQVFELLDQRDFNPRRNGVMISNNGMESVLTGGCLREVL